MKLPAFTTVDAALYYQINDHVCAQFNVTNLFNENYIVSADSNDDCYLAQRGLYDSRSGPQGDSRVSSKLVGQKL